MDGRYLKVCLLIKLNLRAITWLVVQCVSTAFLQLQLVHSVNSK
jgi:hypothetical protein